MCITEERLSEKFEIGTTKKKTEGELTAVVHSEKYEIGLERVCREY